MDRFFNKQEQINQRRAEALVNYPALWSSLISQWNEPDPEDRVWLTYSSNYLFRTNNVRWAIDPLTLNWRMKKPSSMNVARDLCNLSFVLLTHSHTDHLDLDLLAALRDLPITWVVPEFILSKVVTQAGLPRQNIIIPSHLDPIQLNGINILPFNGLHWETTSDGNLKGVPALGYRIECNGKAWMFPGDTRSYDPSQLPAFDSTDNIFAHLWLGRGCALMDEPPLLETFCRFFQSLSPRRLVLTHLNELGRDAYDFWDESHVRIVGSRFRAMSNNIPVMYAVMGESILL